MKVYKDEEEINCSPIYNVMKTPKIHWFGYYGMRRLYMSPIHICTPPYTPPPMTLSQVTILMLPCMAVLIPNLKAW